MSYKNLSLLDYSHDRTIPAKDAADELINVINTYTKQDSISPFYKYFENVYKLPKPVIQQRLRQHIARSYSEKDAAFKSRLKLINIPKALIYYLALIYALIFTKKRQKIKVFKLIIDDICSVIELRRWKKLIDTVGKDQVLCRIDGIAIDEDLFTCPLTNDKKFQNLNISDLLKSIASELFIGIWVVLKVSLKTKVNLFPIALRIIYSYLTYKAFFEANSASYMIQERHYNTDAVKNYMFKKAGGIRTATIQKGVFQRDSDFFYMDIDVFYTLGESGVDEFLEYGGRVGSIVPVGSMFMEHYWFTNVPSNLKQEYDVVYLGFNFVDKMDTYDGFLDDYYSTFRWLVQLKKENPDYKIAIAHHSRMKIPDPAEAAILLDSGVETITKLTGSYALAFSSRFTVTYGSTIAYELSAHNLTTFFLDPRRQCTFLPVEAVSHIDRLRLTTYESFASSVKAALSGNGRPSLTQEEKSNLCLESSIVSERILKTLGSNV
jgi:hypothetical protein